MIDFLCVKYVLLRFWYASKKRYLIHQYFEKERCGHCKRLSQDWARLAKQWHKSDVGLIAEVDCTDNDKGGGKILCNYFGIESFPTLKYGDPNDLNLYDGKRSLQELSNFAEEQLVPICSPSKFGSKFCDRGREIRGSRNNF